MLQEIQSFSLEDVKEVETALRARKKELQEHAEEARQERLTNAEELAGQIKEGNTITFLHKGETLTSKCVRVSKSSFTTEMKTASGKPLRKSFDFLLSIAE